MGSGQSTGEIYPKYNIQSPFTTTEVVQMPYYNAMFKGKPVIYDMITREMQSPVTVAVPVVKKGDGARLTEYLNPYEYYFDIIDGKWRPRSDIMMSHKYR